MSYLYTNEGLCTSLGLGPTRLWLRALSLSGSRAGRPVGPHSLRNGQLCQVPTHHYPFFPPLVTQPLALFFNRLQGTSGGLRGALVGSSTPWLIPALNERDKLKQIHRHNLLGRPRPPDFRRKKKISITQCPTILFFISKRCFI